MCSSIVVNIAQYAHNAPFNLLLESLNKKIIWTLNNHITHQETLHQCCLHMLLFLRLLFLTGYIMYFKSKRLFLLNSNTPKVVAGQIVWHVFKKYLRMWMMVKSPMVFGCWFGFIKYSKARVLSHGLKVWSLL